VSRVSLTVMKKLAININNVKESEAFKFYTHSSMLCISYIVRNELVVLGTHRPVDCFKINMYLCI
jgi:hypothetical protein